LFYLKLAPVYRLIRTDTVAKLFSLRLVLLALSPLLLVALVWVWKRALQKTRLDVTGALLIAGWMLSTDRTMMMVRVDNDWLTWLVGIAICGAMVAFFRATHSGRALWWVAALGDEC
jgi:hypothetical protein